jgi:hypothetical protein
MVRIAGPKEKVVNSSQFAEVRAEMATLCLHFRIQILFERNVLVVKNNVEKRAVNKQIIRAMIINET